MSTDNTNSLPVVAIVVAAGSGSRLGADVPKALVEVGGSSLLARSLSQLAAGGVQEAVVVVPAQGREAFEAAVAGAPLAVVLVEGGPERQHSVANGLARLAPLPGDEAQIVLVHDAARAFVPAGVVARVVDAVRAGADVVVPVVPVADSLREVFEVGSAVVDRSGLRAVQTPQGFRRFVLEEAHTELSENNTIVTDDAAAAEYVGYPITLVEGAREAFKVTDPFDLVVARALVAPDDGEAQG
ncbi:MAG: 2-C-methyl-D-erythritol 4-phosphate cytidylyltransferase [Actinomycetes bacterium]